MEYIDICLQPKEGLMETTKMKQRIRYEPDNAFAVTLGIPQLMAV